ncbi:MAG: undecaprenyl-phosphate glucose phosphotransferase, partial [Marinirhabdus sp.]
MQFERGRYSGYLRPLSYVIDLTIVHLFALFFFTGTFQFLYFFSFISIAWVFLSLKSDFYEIYRFTHAAKIMALLGKQGLVFLLIVYAFFGFYNQVEKNPFAIFKYGILVMGCIAVVKFTIYFLLKKYRLILGGNFRNVVIIGKNQRTEQLQKFFMDNPEYGYKLKR